MKPFVLTSQAEHDLDQILDYLVEDSIDAASRVLDAIEKSFDKLAKAPDIGHFREDLADKRHKFFLVYSYLIVYRFQTKPLQILRVLHTSRDVQALLDQTPD
ncbi:MAG TPA: type II toxin-antitoxin system RelE/ParE family toxin [Candidatus Angelobacter sp.]|jgi:antitoxin ParD1/3/4/toxin ParE1/3/4|nr:type II toxin-antitoxin system RelE/ParE family toxin [Candidatus Angelobacter sp.]